eukprot:8110388-Karenia_brevis.AAC.1
MGPPAQLAALHLAGMTSGCCRRARCTSTNAISTLRMLLLQSDPFAGRNSSQQQHRAGQIYDHAHICVHEQRLWHHLALARSTLAKSQKVSTSSNCRGKQRHVDVIKNVAAETAKTNNNYC